jgi:type VI secretion system protein ImpA
MFSDQLYEPISDASPTGDDGVYSTAFQEIAALADYLAVRMEVGELERLAKVTYQGENAESDHRTAEANLEDGRRKLERAESTVKELTGKAPSPEGAKNELAARGERILAESSKDIRVIQHLALAWMLQAGTDGFEAAMRLIDGLLERHGALLHPQPDPDEPDDVSAREMVLSEMFNGTAFVMALREAALVESAAAGRYTGRDAEVIEGRLEDDQAGGARSTDHITAIAQAMAEREGSDAAAILQARIGRIEAALEAADRVIGRFGHGAIIGDRVLKLLNLLKGQLAAAVPGAEPAADGEGGGMGFQVRAGGATTLGPLRSREDARKQILEIARFLESSEPSHPAPFFLRRAERLLGAKDFFAILRDMAPESISELERITGHRDGTES